MISGLRWRFCIAITSKETILFSVAWGIVTRWWVALWAECLSCAVRATILGLTQRGVGKVQPAPQTSISGARGRPGARWAPSHERQKKRLSEGHPAGTRTLQTSRLRKS